MNIIDPCNPNDYSVLENLIWTGFGFDSKSALTKNKIVQIVRTNYGTPSQFFEGSEWPDEKCYLMLAKAKSVDTEEEVVLIGTKKQKQKGKGVDDVWDYEAFKWVDEETKRVRSFEDQNALFRLTHLVGKIKLNPPAAFNHRFNNRGDHHLPSMAETQMKCSPRAHQNDDTLMFAQN